MIEIILGENDNLDRALRDFRRKVIRSGHMKDMRRKEFYEKPSVARKRKSQEARRRAARARRRELDWDW